MYLSMQLRDVWNDQISLAGAPARIDVTVGLSKMTLDVIGLAGLSYNRKWLSQLLLICALP